MRNSSLLMLLAFVLSPTLTFAAVNVPFKLGEVIKYRMKFKVFNVAELTSEITQLDTDKGTMTLKGNANTKGMGNTFYKSNYDMTASMNLESLSALKFIQHSTEEGGKEVKNILTSCDPTAQTCTVNFDRKRKGEQKQNIKNVTDTVQGRPQSVLSLIYFLRAAALPQKEGTSITVPMMFEETLFELKITNAGALTAKEVDGEHTGTHYTVSQTKIKNIDGQPAAAPAADAEETAQLAQIHVYVANDEAKSVVYASCRLGWYGSIEISLR